MGLREPSSSEQLPDARFPCIPFKLARAQGAQHQREAPRCPFNYYAARSNHSRIQARNKDIPHAMQNICGWLAIIIS